MKTHRDMNDNLLVLDVGNQFHGTLWFNVYQHQATSYFMNRTEYDAMVSNTDINYCLLSDVNMIVCHLINVAETLTTGRIKMTNLSDDRKTHSSHNFVHKKH